MKFRNLKVISLQIFLFSNFFLNPYYKINNSYALEKDSRPTSNYIKNIPENNFYILGPGDVLELIVSEDALELNKRFKISGEGTANLRRLKKIYVGGLTVGELTEILNKEYSNYVKKPEVELRVLKYKPIKFFIDGEVEDPGVHILPGSFDPLERISESSNNEEGSTGGAIALDNSISFPTLIDALKKTGGVSINADLSKIKITRINSLSKGGGRVTTTLNIMKALNLEDPSQNIRLFDGDTIFIARSETPLKNQIDKIAKSNINPKFFSITLKGRVNNPGEILVNSNAVLLEAIDIAGGTKVLKGPINFLRYRKDGSIDRRQLK